MQPRRDERVHWADLADVVSRHASKRCRVVDISHGGARLDGLEGAAPGDELKLFVRLPIPFRERKRFCCFNGEVVWIRDGQAGVRFSDMPLDSFAQLDLGIEVLDAAQS